MQSPDCSLENLKLEVLVTLAQATILQLGGFLWADSIVPSGFASSLLSDLEVSRPDLLQEGIILDYATKHEMSKTFSCPWQPSLLSFAKHDRYS